MPDGADGGQFKLFAGRVGAYHGRHGVAGYSTLGVETRLVANHYVYSLPPSESAEISLLPSTALGPCQTLHSIPVRTQPQVRAIQFYAPVNVMPPSPLLGGVGVGYTTGLVEVCSVLTPQGNGSFLKFQGWVPRSKQDLILLIQAVYVCVCVTVTVTVCFFPQKLCPWW